MLLMLAKHAGALMRLLPARPPFGHLIPLYFSFLSPFLSNAYTFTTLSSTHYRSYAIT